MTIVKFETSKLVLPTTLKEGDVTIFVRQKFTLDTLSHKELVKENVRKF